jgi:hypothetical protein
MSYLPNDYTAKDIDLALIPADIYTLTMEKKTEQIENYFIKHPRVMNAFAGFNGKIKMAANLLSNLKCSCYYKMEWVTQYQVENSTTGTLLTFFQQAQIYRYMIIESSEYSYMKYLSNIALGMLLNIKQFRYNLESNLTDCLIFRKQYYTQNFVSQVQFRKYVYTYF